MVDPGQVEQVIMNLAVNARDAMPDGGRLRIETDDVRADTENALLHVGLNPGECVRLRVTDTGTGMDAATPARMFEPFFTTKEEKGTGLGLATVFGIVQQSGGRISVSSEVGKGSTFSVYLPMVNRALVPDAPLPAADQVALRGSETILLVEDEESVRALTHAILTRCGYDVIDAHSGGDALLLCEQHVGAIQLLLTDVVMPRMNGRQLAERLLKIRPDMRVLYVSGYSDDAITRDGVLDSTSAFLQKPVTPRALARKVREVLGPA